MMNQLKPFISFLVMIFIKHTFTLIGTIIVLYIQDRFVMDVSFLPRTSATTRLTSYLYPLSLTSRHNATLVVTITVFVFMNKVLFYIISKYLSLYCRTFAIYCIL